jgi:DNA polymerase III epsilon subunit-like protein
MIIVDIETTGMDPLTTSIVSIGAVDFADPDNRFYEECRADEGSEITEGALRVNGFSRADVSDPTKPSVAETLGRFFDWVQAIPDRTAGGQKVYFDRDFINAACEKHGISSSIGKRLVDLHGLCYAHATQRGIEIPIKDGLSNFTTDAIFAYVGLAERPGAHNGLEDALLEAESFSRLIFGRNLLPEYAAFPIPEYLE